MCSLRGKGSSTYFFNSRLEESKPGPILFRLVLVVYDKTNNGNKILEIAPEEHGYFFFFFFAFDVENSREESTPASIFFT